jgi:hypothetical protein
MADLRETKDEVELRRSFLFRACESKEELHDWILTFIGIDLPDCIVDPESTSCPMDMVWEVYSKVLAGDDESFRRVIYYASRDSFKTLAASVLEVLVVLHGNCDVGHMAAISEQAIKCQEYVKRAFRRPYLRDFIEGDNERLTKLVRYYNPNTKHSLTRAEYNQLLEEGQGKEEYQEQVRVLEQYIERDRYIKVVICTMQGANSLHVRYFCCDEIDVVTNPAAYTESKAIPAGRAGKLPITVLISTRKTAFGLVQNEIDNAEKTGLQIRHFNILDVTQACEPKRHRPDLPKVKLWTSSEQLKHVSEQTYDQMNFKEKEGFILAEGFAGCAKCKLFSCCRTMLATRQKSKSILLKPIPEVIGKFKDWSVDIAQSQLLCKKPASTGLIYGRFDRMRHILSPAQCYAKVFGELPPNPNDFTKAMLMVAMKERGTDWYGGTDWGSTHNFSYTHGFKDGNVLFVTHCISVPELDPDQMLAIVDPLKCYDPMVWPDTADPKMNKWFKRKGWRYQLKWNKGAGTVVGGINMVRAKLNPPMSDGVPELFFIHDINEDEMMDLLINHLAEYHWKLDAAQKPTGLPDDKNDDECDALRYLVMNLFVGSAGLTASNDFLEEETRFLPSEPMSGYYDKDHWLQQIISQNTGQPMEIMPPKERRMVISSPDGAEIDIGSYYEQQNKPLKKEENGKAPKKGKKGGLVWEF